MRLNDWKIIRNLFHFFKLWNWKKINCWSAQARWGGRLEWFNHFRNYICELNVGCSDAILFYFLQFFFGLFNESDENDAVRCSNIIINITQLRYFFANWKYESGALVQVRAINEIAGAAARFLLTTADCRRDEKKISENNIFKCFDSQWRAQHAHVPKDLD